MNDRGKFISIEGGEGVGKSTQMAALVTAIRTRGHDVIVTREPGGTDGAEAIRQLLLGGDDNKWGARAEALLFAAARSDHVERVIQPALDAGKWVVSDRFIDSNRAYQGSGSGLTDADIMTIHRIGSQSCLPDRTLLLELTVSEAAARANDRDNGKSDRIGGRHASFHKQVHERFASNAAKEPQRVRRIDASGPAKIVTARLLAEIEDLL
jgi:dTMP kinase